MSLHTVLEEADQLWVPEQKSWRLNERHYGGLQDLSKAKVTAQVGKETATAWRRSYATQPPGNILQCAEESVTGTTAVSATFQSKCCKATPTYTQACLLPVTTTTAPQENSGPYLWAASG